jgi:hypothetical protein
MTTPEQERVRLAAVYSAMSDNELLKIANTAMNTKVRGPVTRVVMNGRRLTANLQGMQRLSSRSTAGFSASYNRQRCASFSACCC